MDSISLETLFFIIFILILFSSFFSSAETGMMALNRYRLRHLVNTKSRSAILTDALLEKPDRLIGVILFGNNIVNFLAASIATVIGFRLFGNYGVATAPFIVAIVFIIFAEMLPKTFAIISPERIALPASYVLTPLLYACYPIVYLLNTISNGCLKLFGINIEQKNEGIALNPDELRTIVHEVGAAISKNHQNMLLGILDMEKVSVADIMVKRSELFGINLDDPIADIMEQLSYCKYARVIAYRANIDNIVGVLHTRRVLRICNRSSAGSNTEELEGLCDEPYYLPERASLYTQMLNFQKNKQGVGLVVDEYGVLQGMVTLDDILEEIVGEFTTGPQIFNSNIQPQKDGSFLIDGGTTVRDINKQLNWLLPSEGAKTLNGIIMQYLEDIPKTSSSMRIDNYALEIIQVVDNAVKKVKVIKLTKSENKENATGKK